MKTHLSACIGLILGAAVQSNAGPKHYDLSLQVAKSSVQNYVVGRIPSQTKCTSSLDGGEVKTDCTTTPAQDVTNYTVFLDATLDGVHRDIRCTASWLGSNCATLSPGVYQARWLNKGHTQIRVSVLAGGKPKEITFDVLN